MKRGEGLAALLISCVFVCLRGSDFELGGIRQRTQFRFREDLFAAVVKHVGLAVVLVAAPIPTITRKRAEDQIEEDRLGFGDLFHVDDPGRPGRPGDDGDLLVAARLDFGHIDGSRDR